jgi:hypothetical protein
MPIIVALSGELQLDCDDAAKHGIPRTRDQYRHFNAKADEWQYWTKLSHAGKIGISSQLVNDGKCVLCSIDEKIVSDRKKSIAF